jgi:UTP:GlnB (protein PII) uridylyltransferase
MKNLELLDSVLLSENVFENFVKEMDKPEFSNWLTSIIPEVVDCAKLEQDNPWHIYGCLEHILRGVEEVNKQTKDLPYEDRRLLAYSMFYHDMGKPASHIRRFAKAYGREVDSFFNHNKKSAAIVRRTAAEFGFNDVQVNQIEKLVYDHDIFMFITDEPESNPHHKKLSKDLINEQMLELSSVGDGKKLMQYLIMIGRADNKAQNPEMTAKSLKLLDKMELLTSEMESPEIGVEMQ